MKVRHTNMRFINEELSEVKKVAILSKSLLELGAQILRFQFDCVGESGLFCLS